MSLSTDRVVGRAGIANWDRCRSGNHGGIDGVPNFLSKRRQAEWLFKVATQTFLKHPGGHGFMTARHQNDPHIWIEALEFIEDGGASHWGEPVVQQHHINLSPSLLVNLDGFLWAGGGNRSVALVFQRIAEERPKSRLVVDNENARLWAANTGSHAVNISIPLASVVY